MKKYLKLILSYEVNALVVFILVFVFMVGAKDFLIRSLFFIIFVLFIDFVIKKARRENG